jgi:hypothetical protein
VVHPDLAVGQDVDIDRCRRAIAHDGLAAPVVDAVAVEHVEEDRCLAVTDAGDQPERQPE